MVWVVRMAFWRGQDRNCALDNGVGQTVLGRGDERTIARSECGVCMSTQPIGRNGQLRA